MLTIHIEGEINLRLLNKGDAQQLEDLEPGDLTFSQGELLCSRTPSSINELIDNYLDQYGKGIALPFGIWIKDSLAGTVNLKKINKKQGSGELSYALGSPFRGKGIVTKACKVLISYGFEELNLNRITIIADPRNTPSCAVAERLGFTKEGVLREFYKTSTGWGDGVLYSILKRDLSANKSEGTELR